MSARIDRVRARLPRVGLRKRLILLTLLGLAAFSASFALIGVRAIADSTNETLQDRKSSAQATAQYIDRMLAHSLASLGDLAANSPPGWEDDRDGAVMATYLRDHYPLGDGYAFLAVLDAQGKVTRTVPPRPDLTGATLAALAPELAPARLGGGLAVTNLLHLPGTAAPFIWLAVPLSRGPGPDAATLVGALDLTEAAATNYTGFSPLSGNADVELVDANGILINHSQTARRFLPSQSQALFRSLTALGQASVGIHVVDRGGGTVNRVIAFAPLRAAPWAVAVEQDEGEAFALVNRLKWQLALLAIAFSLLLLFVLWLGTNRVLRPIAVLTRSAQRIAAGDLTTQVPNVGSDEIGALATAFDGMRAKLNDSYRQVQRLYLQAKTRHSHEQTMLLRFSEDILAMADPQWTLDRAAGVAATLASAEFASIVLYEDDQAGVVRAAHGWGLELLGTRVTGSQRNIICAAADQRRPVIVADYQEDD